MNNLSTLTHKKFNNYAKYLQSVEWRMKKNQWKNRANAPTYCFACCKDALAVKHKGFDFHHIRYDNLYDESLNDLILLCRECHSNLSESFIAYKDVCADKRLPLRTPTLCEFTRMFMSWKHKELHIPLAKSRYIFGWVK